MEMSYHTFSNLVQKITIYETKETFYILGSDEAETAFRIVEISRNDHRQLVIHDDHKIYSVGAIQEYLNTAKQNEKKRSRYTKFSFSKVISGYSLAGFVRFTEGYYLIIVTARKHVAMIGSHHIYKIVGTSLLYIPGDQAAKSLSPEEHRYAKLFENMDFSNNFYFSFTYDLTHTLQYNQAPVNTQLLDSPKEEYRQQPEWKFVWNEYLLEPISDHFHQDWIVYLIHGFLSQFNMIVYGKHIYMTLIARRSSKFAGTRFLKRGCNNRGHVANEVETEQIVFDASQTSGNTGAYTSFVQLRGSIPQSWSQDITKVMSKPPISIDATDPYGDTASRHFRELFNRYGASIIILNLVKRREKRKRESLLWDELIVVINYLNQFLVDDHKIRYVSFDMARCNKKKGSNVLAHLDEISERCIEKTGFYVKNCPSSCDKEQTGVIRTNCVDCLDRTNTAQFAVAKHALGHQLYALGVTASKDLLFDTDCIRMLEVLFEDQGDTIALQYGGSNLVHRVQSYRKTNLLYSQTNDILQTLSRYYSNSFSDAEKQQVFNVFLGVFRPFVEHIPLWDLSSDFHLHNSQPMSRFNYCEWVQEDTIATLPKPCNQIHKKLIKVSKEGLPARADSFSIIYRTNELTSFDNHFPLVLPNSIRMFMPKNINVDTNLYNTSPFEVRKTGRIRQFLHPSAAQGFTTAYQLFYASTTASNSNDMSNSSNNQSTAVQKESNSVFHTSVGSTTEDSDSSSSEESDIDCQLDSSEEEINDKKTPDVNTVSFDDIIESPFKSYGVDLFFGMTNRVDVKLYKQYEKIAVELSQSVEKSSSLHQFDTRMKCKSIFQLDSEVEVIPPTVKKEAKAFYKHIVMIGRRGPTSVPKASLQQYEKYVQQLRK